MRTILGIIVGFIAFMVVAVIAMILHEQGGGRPGGPNPFILFAPVAAYGGYKLVKSAGNKE